jgi:hypothetical protein
MSLIQIRRLRDNRYRRMNQLPIYNIYMNDLQNISDINKRDESIEIVQSILYDMINSIETNHNFEIINAVDIPKSKNILQKMFKKTKKWLHLSS